MSRRRVAVLILVIVCGGTAVAFAGGNTRPHRPSLLTPGEDGRVVVSEVDITQPGEVATALAWINGAYHPVRYPLKRYQIIYADGGHTQKIVQGPALDQLPAPDPALANVHPTEEQFQQAKDFLGEHPPEN